LFNCGTKNVAPTYIPSHVSVPSLNNHPQPPPSHFGFKLILLARGEFVANSAGLLGINGTHQLDRSWVKLVAERNMYFISVTLVVSQLEMSELKLVAEANMYFISVTLVVSQLEMEELKKAAFWNILPISITFKVSQLEMSLLKADAA